MKRTLTTVISLFFALTVMTANAAAPSQFAGTWTLDKEKSDELRGPMANANITLNVSQDDKQISIETKYSGGEQEIPTQKMSYNLDGTETTADITWPAPSKGKLSAKWIEDGKGLELKRINTGNFQGQEMLITIIERWSLTEDGKGLRVKLSVDFGQGNFETTLVYKKV